MSNTESLNYTIIEQFERLVNFVQQEIDKAKLAKDTKLATAHTFRLKQIKNVLALIKKYPKKLTDETLKEFAEFQGVGKGSIDRIKEIINKGSLSELAGFKDTITENKKALEELESIVGVGRSTALEWIELGVTSVDDLKNKIKKGEIEVNEKIAMGIKYYGLFLGNIPREEITKVYKLLDRLIKKLNKKEKLDETNHYVFEICGSYRREKPTSGDIDVLISKVGTKLDEKLSENYLEKFVKMLKEPLKSNNNKPLLVDDITDKNYETKYMGFSKYKDNPYRRIDIRFIPWDAYYSALLYFTGSAELNLKMRKIAKTMKLKLSEYGLTKEDGTRLPITSEYDFFKILKIEYLPPRLR